MEYLIELPILQRWCFSASKVYTNVTIAYIDVAILGGDIYTGVTCKNTSTWL